MHSRHVFQGLSLYSPNVVITSQDSEVTSRWHQIFNNGKKLAIA